MAGFLVKNGKLQTWFDLYVSGSVYYQIHMHILRIMFVKTPDQPNVTVHTSI